MDTLRGDFSPLDTTDMDIFADAADVPDEDDEAVDQAPPPAIGQDERRMQVRAYNFWARLLEDRNFPSIEELDPSASPDFGPYSVLLDFTDGIDDPSITFIGELLRRECLDFTDGTPRRLSEVPARSLLSRITDHYMQILANQSPIGFEAEFVNKAGETILYRGILLPFSSDDETIDFIYGVINWKQMADRIDAGELLLEVEHELEGESQAGGNVIDPAGAVPRNAAALTDWADGPLEDVSDTGDSAPVRPSFDLSGQPGSVRLDDVAPLPGSDGLGQIRAVVPELPSAEQALRFIEPSAETALVDWLACAREMAQAANNSEERTRAALYDAVGRAYDFALAAADRPVDLAELLADAGIGAQDRAPMTPIVKLVFGVDYDKTRLTEYAAVLAWAKRNDFAQGMLGPHLKSVDGGLKAIVADERAFRRGAEQAALPEPRPELSWAIAKRLRAMSPQELDAVTPDGREFGLVMIRRTETDEVVVLGEIPADAPLIAKAARKLLG